MSASAEPTVESPQVKLEHVTASVVGRERTSRQVDIQKLQKIWEKKGAEDLFAAEAEEKIDEKQPNFPEIHSVLDSIVDPRRKAALKTKANLMQEIVEGAVPGTIEVGATPDAHVQYVAKVAATMPGMVAAVAKELGVSVAVAKARLEKPALTKTSDVGKLIEGRILKDEKFVTLLRKSIGENLDKPDDLVELDEKISSNEAKVASDQRKINTERSIYTNAAHTGSYDKMETLRLANPGTFDALKINVNRYTAAVNTLAQSATLRTVGISPTINSQAEADALLLSLDGQFNQLSNGVAADHNGAIPPALTAAQIAAGNLDPLGDFGANRKDLNELKVMYKQVETIKNLFTDLTFQANMRNFNGYREYVDSKKNAIDTDQAKLDGEKVTLAKDKSIRDKKVNALAQRTDRLLNKAVKDYYNNTLLTQADKVAQFEAQQKAEDKKAAKDLAEKRENMSEKILDKLQLTYLKYSGKDVVGWDDAALKKFVKEDMLSHSPADMAKKLLERVVTKRSSIPPEYKKEIDDLLKEMGVTAGPPPVTARDVMNSISREKYESWAEKKVPDILGYAWARGYYFDRLKLKPAQAEFLQRAYKEDFFANALAAKGQYADEAATLMAGEFMDGGAITKEKIKEMLGKDWVGGSMKLMKLLAFAGAGFVLGGGLMWPQTAANGGILKTLKLGGKQVAANLVSAGHSIGEAAVATSALGNAGVQAVVGRMTPIAGAGVVAGIPAGAVEHTGGISGAAANVVKRVVTDAGIISP